MKKKLREQLIMLANQILEETSPQGITIREGAQEKKFQTAAIKKLVGELYGALTILEYLEGQLDDLPQPVYKESLDSKSFREESWFTEPEPVPQPDHKEDIVEPLMEKIKDIVAQMPEEHDAVDEMLEVILPQKKEVKAITESPAKPHKETKNDLEEFAANYQRMPEFERKNPELFPPSNEGRPASKNFTESRQRSLNDTVNKGLNIGLNDRLAFIKHLFEGQAEDYTRVLSQINTMENFEEAKNFISGNVKPDYNNWVNKEEYSNRFMAIIEKSFN